MRSDLVSLEMTNLAEGGQNLLRANERGAAADA